MNLWNQKMTYEGERIKNKDEMECKKEFNGELLQIDRINKIKN